MVNRLKIRVGIDAKWYFEGPPSGLVVIRNLVDQLIKNPNGVHLFLFLNKQSKERAEQTFSNQPNVSLIFLKAYPNLLSNFFLIPFSSRKHRLDIVLFQNFGTLLPMKAKRAIYIHDLLFLDYPEYFSKKELFYYQFMVKFSRKADLFITPSVSEKDRMIKHNLGTNKNIHAIHHGLSSKFIPKQKYSPLELKATREKLNLSEYYILYVGRVNVRKNLLNLVKALPAIKDTSIKLVIVGKADSDNSAIHTFITEHNLTDRVLFTGHVDEADLFKIYALAFVFCFPSFAEGFGLPPVEAMQCAIPCVVSNRTSLPEVCGDAGVYINPDDPWDIAEKLNLLIGNREFYQTIRAKSLEQAKKFSWSVAADQILNILVSYCDNGKNY